MPTRTLKKQHPALREDIGDLQTRRPIPGPGIPYLDPFLFLNHHGPQTYSPGNHGLPFGPHPHRGFETVTFIVEGSLAHQDTGGHESIIEAGGIQWMTAGSGLVHAELSPKAFKKTGGPLEILQLWVNLPARLKMTKPRYVGFQKKDIPSFTADEGRVTVNLISGTWDGNKGPYDSICDVHMMTVSLASGGKVQLPAPSGRTVFLYVVRGELRSAGTLLKEAHLIELNDDGDSVELEATRDALVLFGHSEPFREPVVTHGPFVMNTRQQIIEAVNDYQAGKFGEFPRGR